MFNVGFGDCFVITDKNSNNNNCNINGVHSLSEILSKDIKKVSANTCSL